MRAACMCEDVRTFPHLLGLPLALCALSGDSPDSSRLWTKSELRGVSTKRAQTAHRQSPAVPIVWRRYCHLALREQNTFVSMAAGGGFRCEALLEVTHTPMNAFGRKHDMVFRSFHKLKRISMKAKIFGKLQRSSTKSEARYTKRLIRRKPL